MIEPLPIATLFGIRMIGGLLTVLSRSRPNVYVCIKEKAPWAVVIATIYLLDEKPSSSRHFFVLGTRSTIGRGGGLMRRPSGRRFWRRLVLLAMLAVGSTVAGPASAQFFGDRPWFDRPRHSPDYSSPFFGRRGSPWPSIPNLRGPYVQQPPADSKAPPPRKAETPPTSEVLVIGDSLADWLAYGLEEVFADTPEIGIVRKIRPYSGLVRYEAHNDTQLLRGNRAPCAPNLNTH